MTKELPPIHKKNGCTIHSGVFLCTIKNEVAPPERAQFNELSEKIAPVFQHESALRRLRTKIWLVLKKFLRDEKNG